MRLLGFALAFAAGMAVLWFLMDARMGPDPSGEKTSVTVKAVQRLPIANDAATPKASLPPAFKAAPNTPARNVSPLMAELGRARSYKAIHDRLKASQSRTPEESYVLAEILARCGKNIAVTGFTYRPRFGGEERRKQFIDTLSPVDPQREKRIAAFDAVNHDVCAELEGLDAKTADVRALVATAAAGGDPKARAVQLTQEIWDARRGDGKAPPGPMMMTDAQLDTLRSLLSTEDPEAMLTSSRLLQMSFGNLDVRTGADQASLNTAAFQQAAHFVACDLGSRCGPDAPEMAYACAVNGYCSASDYREHAYNNILSAAAAQAVQAYYEQLQRARAGDWSYFTFHRGQSPRSAIHNPIKK